MQASCIFCKIIAQEIPAKVILENETTIVIQDIAPKAPIHYLIIPKKHIHDICALEPGDAAIPMQVMQTAQQLACNGFSSFRLLSNNGPDAGQSVFHLHFHFLSGKKMLDF